MQETIIEAEVAEREAVNPIITIPLEEESLSVGTRVKLNPEVYITVDRCFK